MSGGGEDCVALTSDAVEDIVNLDGNVRRRVVKKLLQINRDPSQMGEPLGGQLAGYRRLEADRKNLRIIWRVAEDGTALVWLVGARSDDECYEEMVERLNSLGEGHPAATSLAVLSNLLQSRRRIRKSDL